MGISFANSQELNKEETLKYIKNILNANMCSDCKSLYDHFDVLAEYQTLIVQIYLNNGRITTLRHNISNASLEIKPGSTWFPYIVLISTQNDKQKSFASLNSLDDAKKLVKAVQHLAMLINDEKDPFE